jgi:hypothetical protein
VDKALIQKTGLSVARECDSIKRNLCRSPQLVWDNVDRQWNVG